MTSKSRALLQAKHVEHVVEAGWTLAQPFCGAHRAAGVGHAALGAEGELKALPGTDEQGAVVADHVAPADGMEADLPDGPLAGITVPAVNCRRREIHFQGGSDDFSQLQRSPGGSVDLVAMVGFK